MSTQLITFSSTPAKGYWTISDGTNTTAPILYNDNALAVQYALEGATPFDIVFAGSVSGDYSAGFTIDATNTLTATGYPASSTGLVTVARTQAGVVGSSPSSNGVNADVVFNNVTQSQSVDGTQGTWYDGSSNYDPVGNPSGFTLYQYGFTILSGDPSGWNGGDSVTITVNGSYVSTFNWALDGYDNPGDCGIVAGYMVIGRTDAALVDQSASLTLLLCDPGSSTQNEQHTITINSEVNGGYFNYTIFNTTASSSTGGGIGWDDDGTGFNAFFSSQGYTSGVATPSANTWVLDYGVQVNVPIDLVDGSPLVIAPLSETTNITVAETVHGSVYSGSISVAELHLGTSGGGGSLAPLYDWAFTTDGTESISGNTATITGAIGTSGTYATWTWADTSGGDWSTFFAGNGASSTVGFKVDGITYFYTPAYVDSGGGSAPNLDDAGLIAALAANGWTATGGTGSWSATCNTVGAGHTFQFGTWNTGCNDGNNSAYVDDGTMTNTGMLTDETFSSSFTDGATFTGLECVGTGAVATAADTDFCSGTVPFELSCTYVPSAADVAGSNPLGADCYWLGWGSNAGTNSFQWGIASGQWIAYFGEQTFYYGAGGDLPVAGTSYNLALSFDGTNLTATINSNPYTLGTVGGETIILTGTSMTFGASAGAARSSSGVLSNVEYEAPSGGSGTDEQQTITMPGDQTGGTWTLTLPGNSPLTFNWNDPASTLQTSIDTNTTFTTATVSYASNVFTLDYGVVGPQSLATADGSGLTGPGVDEQQTITMPTGLTSGTWALTLPDSTVIKDLIWDIPYTTLQSDITTDSTFTSAGVSQSSNIYTLDYGVNGAQSDASGDGTNLVVPITLNVYQLDVSYTSSGGAVTGGSSPSSDVLSYTSSGGAVTGGSDPSNDAFFYTSSGGANTAGSSPNNDVFNYTGAGGAVTGGSALVIPDWTYTSTGGAVSGGAAIDDESNSYTSTGGAVSSGSSLVAYAWISTGGAVTAGSPPWGYTSTGGALAGGSSPSVDVDDQSFVSTGGAITGGSSPHSINSRLVIGGSVTVQPKYSGTVTGGSVAIST